MKSNRSAMRGYSLAEILVVVGIIGIMSLVTIPQFVSYQHSAKLRGALRGFTSDLRNCRQLAIARYIQVRVEFPTTKTYRFYYRSGQSGAWSQMPQEYLMAMRISGVYGNTKTIADPMVFLTGSTTFTDMDGNSTPDIVFNLDGSVQLNTANTQSSGYMVIESPWKNVASNQMKVTLYSTGKLSTLGQHS